MISTNLAEKIAMMMKEALCRVSAEAISSICGQSISYAEAGSYLDFLLPVLPKNCIRVQVKTGEELAADTFRE